MTDRPTLILTTPDTITREQIVALAAEAGAAGDTDLAEAAERALDLTHFHFSHLHRRDLDVIQCAKAIASAQLADDTPVVTHAVGIHGRGRGARYYACVPAESGAYERVDGRWDAIEGPFVREYEAELWLTQSGYSPATARATRLRLED